MSCYNQCKECKKNEDGWCKAKEKKIWYFDDTSSCRDFESKDDDNNLGEERTENI